MGSRIHNTGVQYSKMGRLMKKDCIRSPSPGTSASMGKRPSPHSKAPSVVAFIRSVPDVCAMKKGVRRRKSRRISTAKLNDTEAKSVLVGVFFWSNICAYKEKNKGGITLYI